MVGARPSRHHVTTGQRATTAVALGFAAGPFDVAGAYGKTDSRGCDSRPYVAGSIMPAIETSKTWNVGGSWDFGFVQDHGLLRRREVPVAARTDWYIGQRRDSVRPGRDPRRLRSRRDKRRSTFGVDTDEGSTSSRSATYRTTCPSAPRCTARLLARSATTTTRPSRSPVAARRPGGADPAATRRASSSACVTSSDLTLASRKRVRSIKGRLRAAFFIAAHGRRAATLPRAFPFDALASLLL